LDLVRAGDAARQRLPAPRDEAYSAAVIQVADLTRKYGSFVAVDHMSLEIPDGAIFGLLGPNGAGKSTTVKCIAGLLRPTSGRVLVNGVDVAQKPLEVKAMLGYVPEGPVLFPTLSGRELLTLVGRMHRMDESALGGRIEELLTAFGLGDKSDHQVHSYSKGMAQKLAIAAALLPNPRLLVLDEALNGLDAASAAVLKRLLRGLADAGKTVIFCSHILEVVERLCDEIAVVAHGRLRARGSVSSIMAESGSSTLEQAFISLTGETDVAREASEILAALGTDGASRPGAASHDSRAGGADAGKNEA
jgi:ABC-2 type transport system ATP-binding protein